jgi:hypothetical protein
MKNAVLWDVTPSGSCENRHFGGTCRIYHQDKRFSALHLLATANAVLS